MLNLHKVRRGQVFSFTLTELILLILFILLLLLWVITDKKNKLDKEMNSELVKDFILAFPDAKLTSVTEEEDA